ncbi:cyclic nucleotide-binding/CBS domain-containing protein [Nanoarchaeota archaeon]
MKIGIKVGDVMTRQLIAVTPSEKVIDCAKMMVGKDVGIIIVKKSNKLMGVLTEKDVIWALTKKGDLRNVKAGDIMLRKINTIRPSRDIYEALVRMKKQNTKWLPITVNGRVIGILTINDILRIEPGLFELVRGNMNIREAENKFKMRDSAISGEESWREGECESCGEFDLLRGIDGEMMCEGCRDNIQTT